MRKGEKNPLASRNLVRQDFRRHPAITVAETSELAGVTIKTVEDWLVDGKIQRANVVGPYRVDRMSLERWLKTGFPQGRGHG